MFPIWFFFINFLFCTVAKILWPFIFFFCNRGYHFTAVLDAFALLSRLISREGGFRKILHGRAMIFFNHSQGRLVSKILFSNNRYGGEAEATVFK